MDPNSDFQKKMAEYLESVHQGEFMNGTMEDIRDGIDLAEKEPTYIPPTMTLPDCPPPKCPLKRCTGCFFCTCLGLWWHKFKHVVDDLL